jgi:molybdopterin-guanine dinucleotide biosynthesis protein A
MYDRAMEAQYSDVAAFILAGGQSTRMGTDKAFVVLDGKTLVERALKLARSLTSNVSIVGSAEKFAALAPVVEDAFPDCGPLAGIHAALRASSAELNLILAVDVPFASADLLRYLLARARESAAVAIVPRTGGWQPLCAVYRREFAEVAEPALRDGRYKITTLFDAVEIEAIERQELEAEGFSAEMFRNLNTPAELASAAGIELKARS